MAEQGNREMDLAHSSPPVWFAVYLTPKRKMTNRRMTRAKLRDKRRAPDWITSRLAARHVLDGIDLRIESCPQFWKLWIPKTPSRLKMQVFGPFVRSSSFP